MDVELLIKGVILGFSVSAPIGPIGLFCISRTLKNGALDGLAAGTGAALADVLYALIATIGFAQLSQWLLRYATPMQFVGALALMLLGLFTLRSAFADADEDAVEARGGKPLQSLATTFLLIVSNPLTILIFATLYAGLAGERAAAGVGPAVSFVLGVFLGAMSWWSILVGITSFTRERLSPRVIRGIQIAAGLLICALAIVALITALRS